jgi:hypothetical protein
LRACTALAAALDTAASDSDPAHDARLLAAEVRQHARLLLDAGGRRGVAASLHRSDPLPVRQVAELYQALQHPRGLIGQIAADPDVARGFAAALVDTTRALAETADRHLAAGTWLVQVEVDDGWAWRPPESWHQIPKPFQALRAAAVHAERLGRTLPPAREQPAPAPAPRQALAPVPFTALRAPARPARPASPPLPVAARTLATPGRPLRR